MSELIMQIKAELQNGKGKLVKELTQKALDEGIAAQDILNDGLLAAMDIIAVKFKNNDVYVPEVLIAARAMNGATALLKPYLAEAGAQPLGKCVLGTVKGDLHDIGKNLVRMMFEGKGIEVIDLGVDVSPEKFLEAVRTEKPDILALSALLTTTMNEMKNVVDYFVEHGERDSVVIMVGGAPVNDTFCKQIGADIYTTDAASAAEAAKAAIIDKRGA